MSDDLLRPYDAAMVAKLGARVVNTPEGRPYHVVDVPGIAAPVALTLRVPEDWLLEFTTPGINVSCFGLVPDPSRELPVHQGRERSLNPETPNTWNLQAVQSQPVRFLYRVRLQAALAVEMNLLASYVLRRLPAGGYGSLLVIDGRWMPFEWRGLTDTTPPEFREGRLFTSEHTYSVQGWLTDLECTKVHEILTTEITVAPTS